MVESRLQTFLRIFSSQNRERCGRLVATAAGSLISDWIQPLFDSAISFYLLKMNILHLGLSSISCKPSANYRCTSFACVHTVYFFVLDVLKFQLLAV